MSTVDIYHVTPIQLPGARDQTVVDINDHGQIVGHFDDGPTGNRHGFVYRDGSYTSIDFPGATSTMAMGINNLGQIVGQYSTLTQTHGFLYDRGAFVSLAYPANSNLTGANGINDRGEVVGQYQDSRGANQAFLYKCGKFSTIAYPGTGIETSIYGINNGGQAVGSFADPHRTQGVVYLENIGVFSTPINAPGGNFQVTTLRAVNHGGQATGGYFDSTGQEHPFIYFDHRCNVANFLNLTFSSISLLGLNDRGQVVGNYSNGTAPRVSFVAAIAT